MTDFWLTHAKLITPRGITSGAVKVSQGRIAAIRTVARTEGLFLDPTYNGKAMVGLIDQIRQGRLGRQHTVVLVHTGGLPALFNEGPALAQE